MSYKTITQQFGLDEQDFENTGALNSVLNVDSKLFVDPALLRETNIPEFASSHAKVLDVFRKVFLLLNYSKKAGDSFWKSAVELLYGKEIKGLCIGYSSHGTAGSGFGPELIEKILCCGKEIIDAGIGDPEIFELVGLMERNIGPDRMSDLICRIISEDIYKYSESVFSKFKIPLEKVVYEGHEYMLPMNSFNGESIKVLPKSILNDLPLWSDWEHFDVILRHNQNLRRSLNSVIGDTWKEASKQGKERLRRALLENPELLNDLLSTYKGKNPKNYDYKNDPAGEIIWKAAADCAAERFPLDFKLPDKPSPEDVRYIIRLITDKFKDLVENNGMWDLLYKEDLKPKNESASQLLFFGVSDAYCSANNIDLSREPNAGRGPVDFKYSRGYSSRVLVEIKLSSNKNLEHGFSKQIEQYELAEKTQHSVCVIIHVLSGSSQRVEKILTLAEAARKAGKRCPDVYVVDAIPKDSASKFKI